MSDIPQAFPGVAHYTGANHHEGMTLRDWFAGQALSNSALCTGSAPEYQLKAWFGGRTGIMRHEIAARQAGEYADAMLAQRS